MRQQGCGQLQLRPQEHQLPGGVSEVVLAALTPPGSWCSVDGQRLHTSPTGVFGHPCHVRCMTRVWSFIWITNPERLPRMIAFLPVEGMAMKTRTLNELLPTPTLSQPLQTT